MAYVLHVDILCYVLNQCGPPMLLLQYLWVVKNTWVSSVTAHMRSLFCTYVTVLGVRSVSCGYPVCSLISMIMRARMYESGNWRHVNIFKVVAVS